MLRCAGEVVRYERKPWTMEGRSGITKTARVQTTRADFVDVKVPDDAPEPRDGDIVDWAVSPGVNNGRMTINLRGDWAAIADGAKAAPALKSAS
jgi:hypothetical protein